MSLAMMDSIGIHRTERVVAERRTVDGHVFYWLKFIDTEGQEFNVTVFGEPEWELSELPPEHVTIRDSTLELG